MFGSSRTELEFGTTGSLDLNFQERLNSPIAHPICTTTGSYMVSQPLLVSGCSNSQNPHVGPPPDTPGSVTQPGF